MDEQIVTKDKKFTCTECRNENLVDTKAKEGDVIECQFCGIEYEIAKQDETGEFMLNIIEEEK